MHRSFIKPLLFVIIFSLNLFAQPTLNKILAMRSPDRSINIVFVAEGYTQAQKPMFDYIANRTMVKTITADPFDKYLRFFNFYSVWAPSKETGISNDSITVDNYWGAKRMGICTQLQREDSLKSFLDHSLPQWTIAIVMYRDDAKRGLHTCAGRITMTPDRITTQGSFIDSEMVSVIIHEYGHTLAGLADEHELLTGGNADKRQALGKRAPTVQVRNTTTNVSSRDVLPWKEWVDLSTPIPTPDTGPFESSLGAFLAKTSNWYRPRLQCRMRNLYKPLCEVCREGHIVSFYQYTGPIDSFVPAPKS